MAVSTIPVVDLSSSDASGRRSIPLVGMGTASYPFAPETTKPAILHAIGLGYRHFDTSSLYETEPVLGEAVEEALRLRLIKSRAELFITTKLWCTDAHPDLVLPAIQTSLRNLKLDYLDLYLIHWPMSLKSGARPFPVQIKDILPMDLKAVWEAMEECQRRGLTRSIGVSNFTTKKLEELLQYAKIPPAVNQVEMNPVWQQKKLREFCKERNIHVTAYSPIGGQDGVSGQNPVRDSEVLKGIAKAKGKTVAQVSLRWVYEQGVSIIVKSFNKERLKENLEIFDWELSEEDLCKISQIRQRKKIDVGQIAVLSQESLETIDLSDFSVVE